MGMLDDKPGWRAASATVRPFSVFISYRRGDTGQSVEQIRDRLAIAFGEDSVYLDTRQEPGVEWLNELRTRGSRADVFLALIGPGWVEELKRRARTIDYVRKEAEWALSEWPGHVVPVLVGADVPDVATLPRSIRALFGVQSVAMRIGSMSNDLEKLVEVLKVKQASGERPIRTFESSAAQLASAVIAVASPVDEPGDVQAPSENHYRAVIKSMLAGSVVPVIGPGARGRPPESRQLADGFAERYRELVAGVAGLPEVAQRVLTMEDEAGLIRAMRELLNKEPELSAVHLFLAMFPRTLRTLGRGPAYQLIVTTSYDRALERSFEQVNEPYDLVVYVRDLGQYVMFPWGEQEPAPTLALIDPDGTALGIDDDHQLERTMIVRLHGTSAGAIDEVSWNDGYIVTEDDYIDYAPAKLPRAIVAKLTWNSCLFLGYRLSEWNARVLLRRAWTQRKSRFWAIEETPDALESTYWQKVPNSVLLSQPLADYVRALARMLENWPENGLG